MTEGVIAPIGDAYQLLELEEGQCDELTVEFAFAHDRIQQAAYALLDETRKKQAHLRIGRLLLNNLPESRKKERLFDITNHLNLGLKLITDENEKASLCLLNLEAGKKARASTANQAACLYLNHALNLLPDEPWQVNYELTLELHTQFAEAALLATDYDSMESRLTAGLANAKNLLDKVHLYLVQISALIAQGKQREAIDLGKSVLAQLGHVYPNKPTKAHVIAELMKTMWALRNVSVETLCQLPEMTDPYHLAANTIGVRIGAVAMFVEPELLSMMTLRSSLIQFKHGHCATAVSAWSVYGMVLATELNNPEKGLAYGQMAITVAERLNATLDYPIVVHVHNALVRHWKEPVRNCIEPLQTVVNLALDTGNFEYVALAKIVR
ncbi:MAG TPA: hypothetical protein VFM46_05230, partial [Pseudomonadales bacterium]|nr:hypothetical protein [Pseudomonadales bacterium]